MEESSIGGNSPRVEKKRKTRINKGEQRDKTKVRGFKKKEIAIFMQNMTIQGLKDARGNNKISH
ncbi:Hypothetical protein CINCED_3A003503 [Cinara cedri]|uniref:Uncharacterized protein n=1 Tax=Cinara cedri TaxID=506608 RepID=A0A5E4NDI3_9HEMI|nr:Hypothetical protein CINCED_3A003503 [Cinara cedri]